MELKCLVWRSLFFLFVFFLCGFSQTYKDDSLAVRAILDSNGLKTITVEEVTITDSTRIIELLLFFENIRKIPPEIGKLTQLKVLYLFFNNITYIPPNIGKLTNLTELRLSSNLLRELPYEIGDLSSLEILDLSTNSLDSIPFTIGNLKNLDSLFLQSNNQKALPVEIGMCTKLKSLMLGVNFLEAIPLQIGNCTQIVSLGLEYNRLTTLPASITALKPAQFCDLGYNKMIAVDTAIALWADTYDPDWRQTQEGISPITNPVLQTSAAKPGILVSEKTLHFSIPARGVVSLNLYTCQGRLIQTLVNCVMPAGSYRIPLASEKYGSGMCYAVLKAAGSVTARAVIIIY